MTQCQDEFRNLSGCVIKILTACRMLHFAKVWCQIEPEIHSFPATKKVYMFIHERHKFGSTLTNCMVSKVLPRKTGIKHIYEEYGIKVWLESEDDMFDTSRRGVA